MTEVRPEGEAWQRLDPRMMLVHPIREVIRFLPVLLGVFVASAATRGDIWFQLAAIGVPVLVGLVRFYTTAYRFHADRVELRRGLFTTNILSTPLDRVRTVDLSASPIQRLLGLATVRIGTGTATAGEGGLDLDGLPAVRARALRHQLLTSIAPVVPATEDDAAPLAGERVVARFEPGWLRYAPFTSSGFVVLAGLVGVGSQVLGGLDITLDAESASVDDFLLGIGLVAIPVGLLVGGVVVTAFSVLGYLVTNGNFALSHTLPDGSWHVRRGLLTTRETSVDDDRLRGVSIGEPLGLRLARGARLSAIVTGLDRSRAGSSALLPPTPRELVDRVAADVTGAAVPVVAELTGHGARARARRLTRALAPAGVAAAALVALSVATGRVWPSLLAVLLLVAGAGLGFDRARGLGHGLVDGWLVARSGSLTRRRELLATDAIIGWNLRATWFQRRAGLVTLVAATAGGRQAVVVLDVPEPAAVDLASQAVPDLVSQFVEGGGRQQSPRSTLRHTSSPPRP